MSPSDQILAQTLLTPQVADTRTILVGSQHPGGVYLQEFPWHYQWMPSSCLIIDANTWLIALCLYKHAVIKH